MLRLTFHFSTFIIIINHCFGCKVVKFETGTVCACSENYCDKIPPINLNNGSYQIYSTSMTNMGFNSRTENFESSLQNIHITVNPSETFQKIYGFGGAFTDAAGINIKSLSEKLQNVLLNDYFGEDGIDYSFGRVPIGGTDFSTRPYTYDDYPENDVNLSNFTLQMEDYKYKIPYIKKAMNLKKGRDFRLFASPWTAPPWMKNNDGYAGVGVLEPKYYQAWANYFVKFFEAYKTNNITFWGVTVQNEPVDGFAPKSFSKINAMGFTPMEMYKFVGDYLGPTIRKSEFKDLQIIAHDDSRTSIFALVIILNGKFLQYIDGVGIHWYFDEYYTIKAIDMAKTDKKKLFYFGTEASNGPKVIAGSFSRGMAYASNILWDLKQNFIGWMDWNLALNMNGGPTYIHNNYDSPIIINATANVFYKQPMFYAMGHYSKFIRPGSVRLNTTIEKYHRDHISAMGFLRPDGIKAIVIVNTKTENVTLNISDGEKFLSVNVEGPSFNTILYN